MPVAIPLVLGVASAGLLAAPAAVGAFLGISAGWVTAIGVGLSVLSSVVGMLLQQQPPKPQFEDGSQSIKQAIPPRIRAYGIYRRGEDFMYYDTNDTGDLISLGAHCAHEVDSIVENWLNDKIVELDEDGGVTTDSYQHLGTSYVFIKNYLGTAAQVVGDMPGEWDPAKHKGHGICCSWMKCSDGSAEDQQKIFPNGVPNHRVTLRAAKIYDPRNPAHIRDSEATYTWSDNAALVILDYLTRTEPSTIGPIPVGFGLDWDEIDINSFIQAANDSDTDILLKEGGSEKRWRLWGAYEMNEDRKKVLADMLDCCGGRLVTNPKGQLGLVVGMPQPVASVTVEDDHILNYSLDQGLPPTDRINEVRVTFISRLQDWNETEAGIQSDQVSIDRNGVQSSSAKLRFCPSDSQAQRVGRYLLRRGNPTCSGSITGDLSLINAWGERWIRLNSKELDYDVLCEIKTMRINRTDSGISVEVEFMSYDDWWEWDAAVDQQAPALPPPRTPRPTEVPAPTGVTAVLEYYSIDVNTSYSVAVVSWDPAPRPSFIARGRWRKLGETTWIPVDVPAGQLSFKTGVLQDNVTYEVQVQWLGSRRTESAYAPAIPYQITAVSDPIPPLAPVGLTAVYDSGTGQATLTVSAPNDPHFASLFFFRNSANDFSTASQIAGPFYGSPGVAAIYGDTPPDAGVWYYWAVAKNRSNVAGPPSNVDSITISPALPIISTSSATIGNANPVVNGTAHALATVRVYVDSVLNQTVAANGAGTWTANLTGLALGARSITADQIVGGAPSGMSAPITLTRVWYDPNATLEIDFRNRRYRLNGTEVDALVSGWGGLFTTITVPAQMFDRGDGLLRWTAANVLPIGLTALRGQPTRTNRNTNYNANPALGAPVNLTVTGTGTVQGVNDAAKLAAGVFADASMASVFTSGNAIQVDTTGAAADTLILFGGTVASTAAHSFQICARSNGSFTVETNAGTPVTLITGAASSDYVRYTKDGFIPGSATEQVRLRVPPNRTVYIALNDLETGDNCSGPIVIAGAAATRSSPNVLRTLGAEWNQTEGYIGCLSAKKAGSSSNVVISQVWVDSTHGYYMQYIPGTTMRGGFRNTSTVVLDKTGLSLNNYLKMVMGYKLNDVAVAVEGLAPATGSSFTPPTGSWSLQFLTATNAFDGNIERFKIGATKPTNAQIQAMSAWDIS